MKKYLLFLLTPFLWSIQANAQTSELFPRYTVVDVAPQITGDKSLEQLQKEYQENADKSLKGKVRVDYLVLPNGLIGDCRVNYTRPEGNEDLAHEGKMFVASLPQFTPGVLNGENVRTWQYVILNFGNFQDDGESYPTTLGMIQKRKTKESKGKFTELVPFDEVEQMPSFPGGVYSLVEYLSNNIHYPEECVKQKIEGRVLIDFVIEKDGSMTSIEVKNPVHPLLDQEALRVIRKMPRWFPATAKNVTVRVKYTVPITFRL